MVRQYDPPRRGNNGRGGRRGGHNATIVNNFYDFDKPDRRSAKQKMRAAFEEAQDAIDRYFTHRETALENPNADLQMINSYPTDYRPQRNSSGLTPATDGTNRAGSHVASSVAYLSDVDPIADETARSAALGTKAALLQAELIALRAQMNKSEPEPRVKSEAFVPKAEENDRNDVVNNDDSKHNNLAGFPSYIKREY